MNDFFESELVTRAQQESAAGNVDAAIYFYEEQLKRYPDDWRTCLKLVDIYYEKCKKCAEEYRSDYKKYRKDSQTLDILTICGNLSSKYNEKLRIAKMIMPKSELYRLNKYKSLTKKDFVDKKAKLKYILIRVAIYLGGVLLTVIAKLLGWEILFFILLVIMIVATLLILYWIKLLG